MSLTTPQELKQQRFEEIKRAEDKNDWHRLNEIAQQVAKEGDDEYAHNLRQRAFICRMNLEKQYVLK